MTREEAAKQLEILRVFDAPLLREAVNMAISALRAQQEPNAPLTLDELREMDGEPVFLVDLVHKSDPKIPPLWDGWIVFTKHDPNGFTPRGGGFFSNDGYGNKWLAYRHKPEEGKHETD